MFHISTMDYTLVHGVAWSVVVASLYVISFHVAKPTYIAGRLRDDPVLIKYRLRRISLLSLGLVAVLPVILATVYPQLQYTDIIKSFRFHFKLGPVILSLMLICSLYVGPILHYFVLIRGDVLTTVSGFQEEFLTLEGFRDHIFAPVTEELIYRSIVLAILQPVSNPFKLMVYSPLLFGVAHIHHGYELYFHRNINLGLVLISGLCQLTYTTLFGILANYVFFKYGSVWCLITVHSVCNLIGFPELLVSKHPVYTYAYYGLLVAGIGMFIALL